MTRSLLGRSIAMCAVLSFAAIAFQTSSAFSADNNKGATTMLNVSGGFETTLKQLKADNKSVEVHLRNGKSLKGLVGEVGDHYVVITKLAGRDFFSALVRIESIDALETQTSK